MIADAEEWADDWESIREGYFLGEPDESLLQCVEQLRVARAAVPQDPDATAFFTYGLVLMHGHAASEADPQVADVTVEALLAAASDPALVGRACGHETHPCDESDVDEQLESFGTLLSSLAGGSEYTWDDLDGKGRESEEESRWRCPRNVAGFARWAAAAIR
ncbi:hypothetical protein [Streptomyces sp. NPDC093600]|uniref:hypothetical protein n=1 Tax=Streptomyces sp. NPDC093600 TaxID=3366047 RepID=UPI00380E78A3